MESFNKSSLQLQMPSYSSKTATAEISFLLHPGSMLRENRARGSARDVLAACRGKWASGLNKDLKQKSLQAKAFSSMPRTQAKMNPEHLIIRWKISFLKILKVTFIFTYTRQPALSSRYKGWGKNPLKRQLNTYQVSELTPSLSVGPSLLIPACHQWQLPGLGPAKPSPEPQAWGGRAACSAWQNVSLRPFPLLIQAYKECRVTQDTRSTP